MTEEKQTLKLYTFTNKEGTPHLAQMLSMFYSAAFKNSIGIMEALNTETNKEELILVGIELEEDGTPACFPIARCLPAEEVGKYAAPDTKGGWKTAEAEEAKEQTKQ